MVAWFYIPCLEPFFHQRYIFGKCFVFTKFQFWIIMDNFQTSLFVYDFAFYQFTKQPIDCIVLVGRNRLKMNMIYEWSRCIEFTYIASRDEIFSFIAEIFSKKWNQTFWNEMIDFCLFSSESTVFLLMVKRVRDDTISRDWFALKNVGMGFLENEISSWISRLAHFIWLM